MNSLILIEKLKNGERIYGTAIVSPSALWGSVIKSSGLDFVFIDTEHISLGRETISNMCNLYSALGFPPIVRIPSPDPYEACKVLDGGAAAILVPYVESVEQVKQLVGAVKYRPLKGKKLNNLLNNPNLIDKKLQSYIKNRCKNNLLFINIESGPAVENLSDLLDVQGIDGIIIGPHDLSCSIGLPEEYDHPAFEQEVLKIIKECKKRSLGVGIHLSEEPEQQVKWGEMGMNIILHSSDISLFNKILNKEFSMIKAALGDSELDKEDDSIII